MNEKNENKRELTYSEAKAEITRLRSEQQANNLLLGGLGQNLEFGEEFAKKNNSNNEQSANIKTEARKDNNVKKADDRPNTK